MDKHSHRLPEKPTPREREMRRTLAEARRRGEGYEAVAKRLGVSASTVRWWSSQVRRRAARRAARSQPQATSPSTPSFVEVRVDAPRSSCFEVELRGERKLRVPTGFDATELQRLIAVLDPSC